MSLNDKLLKAAAAAGGITPSEHFGVVLYEGDGSSSYSINGGKFGAGAYFDGSNSTISTPITTNYSNLSISCWVYFNALPTGGADATLVSKGFYSSGSNTEYVHLRYENSQNQFTFALRKNSSYNQQALSGVVASINTWYHVVGTLDSSGNAQIYVNGTAGTGITSVPTMTNTNDFEIGSFGTTVAILNGKIDQVRIFTKELSSSEVSTLYAETADTVESLDPLSEDTTDTLQVLGDTSCVALYKLENDETDKSGNYNGTGTAIQYAAGRYGQGAVFSASDSKINIPDNFGAEGETVSYSLWFKTTSANGSYMFAKQTGNNTFQIDK